MTEQKKNKDVLRGLEHDFDGIQEYDNDLPGWWVTLFLVSIGFAACYLLYFHTPLFQGPSLAETYKNERTAFAQKLASQEEKAAGQAQEQVAQLKSDPALAAQGKVVFASVCAPCHRPDGGGSVGPNLTDNYWIHGANIAAVLKVINEGILDKGMPAWKAVLGREKVLQAAAYIWSIQGSNPPQPKAPQGTEGTLQ